MYLVTDTSTIIAVIANEPEKKRLIDKSIGMKLIAPFSLKWEIGNAFSAMMKRGRITLDLAEQAIEVYKNLSVQLVDVDLTEAIKIVDNHKIYAYDAYMIACALKYDCPLLTLDGGLAYAAKAAGVLVEEVV